MGATEIKANARLSTFAKILQLFFYLSFCVLLVSCASSNVSRNMSSSIESGFQNVRNKDGGGNMADSYQNSSQRTKGIIMGGVAGAAAGALYTSSVGVIPGAAVGAIFGGAYGSYIDANTTLRDRLVNRGLNIVILGDQILIVAPSARFFEANTANIKPEAYSTLNMLAQYLDDFTKMLVKITAYTGDTGSPRIDYALSTQQANNLEKYFIATGINARLLYAEGCGSGRPMSTANQWESDNYRIEITLEKLYV